MPPTLPPARRPRDEASVSSDSDSSSSDSSRSSSSSSSGSSTGSSTTSSRSSSSSSSEPEVLPAPPAEADDARIPRLAAPLFTRLEALPYGRHRAADFFRHAVAMFCDSLKAEVAVQQERRGTRDIRFLWKNSGPVAENFAVVCDQTKLLHQALRGGGNNDGLVAMSTFLQQMLEFVQRQTGVADAILNLSTYRIKLKDWESGGTRYTTAAETGPKSNVVFASADQRTSKLEKFIESRTGAAPASAAPTLEASATIVSVDGTVAAAAAVPPAAVAVALAAPAAPRSVLTVKTVQGRPGVVAPRFQTDILLRTRAAAMVTDSGYPAQERERIGTYVDICRAARDPVFRQWLLAAIVRSTRAVHQAFERRGGLVVVHAWALEHLRVDATDAEEQIGLTLLEQAAQLQCAVGRITRLCWAAANAAERPLVPPEAPRLDWLRALFRDDVAPARRANRERIIGEMHALLTRTIANTIAAKDAAARAAEPHADGDAAAAAHQAYHEWRLRLAAELREAAGTPTTTSGAFDEVYPPPPTYFGVAAPALYARAMPNPAGDGVIYLGRSWQLSDIDVAQLLQCAL